MIGREGGGKKKEKGKEDVVGFYLGWCGGGADGEKRKGK